MVITINAPEGYIQQAHQAGFDSLEQYIQHLLEQDAERAAIREGIRDMENGDVMDFDDFDQEFRAKHGIPPRSYLFMYRLVITNAARRDIDAIYAYWATNRSRDEAVKLYIEIGDAIDQLRRSPESNSLAIEVPPFSY